MSESWYGTKFHPDMMFSPDLMCFHHFLRQFTYKPGWRFQIVGESDSMQMLDIVMKVPDSYGNARGPIDVIFRVDIPDRIVREPLPKMHLARWLRVQIKKAELHEMDEWFEIDKEKVFDPHNYASQVHEEDEVQYSRA